MSLLRLAPLAATLLLAALQQTASAQYRPQNPGLCANGYTFSAGMCMPRSGGGNAYRPQNPGLCANGYTFSAGMCVPRR